jgi:P4 family phage/plasmid primase-like protien
LKSDADEPGSEELTTTEDQSSTIYSVPPDDQSVKKVLPTPEQAQEIARERQAAFDLANMLLSPEAIRKQAQQFVDMGMHIGAILPIKSFVEDDQGKKHWYDEIGKKPLYKSWPDLAFHDDVKPFEIPGGCNIFILCGTPIERNGEIIGYVLDVDLDQAWAIPIFLHVFELFGLPPALKWGHESKRSSHLMYWVDKPTNAIGTLCHGIAEIRCQTKTGDFVPYGNQSVPYPSVWTKDTKAELIEREPDSAAEPPLVSCDLVVKAFRTAMAVALLAQLMPKPPHYDIRSAFYRLAACGGMDEADAVRFISLVERFAKYRCKATNQDIEREAANIYEIVEGDPAFKQPNAQTKTQLYGFPTIIQHVGEDNTELLSDVLELLYINSPYVSGVRDLQTKAGGRKAYAVGDTGNGQRFADKFNAEARYVPEDKSWYVDGGICWRLDRNNRVQEMAKTLAQDIYDQAASMKLKDDATDEEKKAFDKMKHAVETWAARTTMIDRISAAVRSASSVATCITQKEEFDTHHNLLNCPNGIVDLYTGEIQPYDPTLFITKRCPVEYHPEAKSSLFDDFLATICKNHSDVPAFLQIFMGYVAQGCKTQEIVAMIFGPGNSGKGTFLSLIDAVLGSDYVCNMSPDSLLSQQRSGGAASGDIARLEGFRLAITSEFKKGDKLNQGFLKLVSGGDKVVARRMYGEEREFVNRAQIIFQSNHRPEINAFDTGNNRRYIEIPFDNPIPRANVDHGYKKRMTEDPQVLQAVLAWIVAGCIKWHRDGLPKCASVDAATAQFFKEMDVMFEFVDDTLIVEDDVFVTVNDMNQAYIRWCMTNGVDGKKNEEFKKLMTERGLVYKNHRVDGAVIKVWSGARLNDRVQFDIDPPDQQSAKYKTAQAEAQARSAFEDEI